MTSLPFSRPRSFPCNFLPLPCRGGWLGAAGCSPEPAKAMPTTALPAQHLHSLGKLLHCQGSLGSICHPELHSQACFPRMRLQALFPWWGTLQETAQLLVGAREAGRIPVVAVPLSKFQLLPLACCWLWLCSSAQPLVPLWIISLPDFQEHNQKLIPAWVLAHHNKTWDYNSQQRHLESCDPPTTPSHQMGLK